MTAAALLEIEKEFSALLTNKKNWRKLLPTDSCRKEKSDAAFQREQPYPAFFEKRWGLGGGKKTFFTWEKSFSPPPGSHRLFN